MTVTTTAPVWMLTYAAAILDFGVNSAKLTAVALGMVSAQLLLLLVVVAVVVMLLPAPAILAGSGRFNRGAASSPVGTETALMLEYRLNAKTAVNMAFVSMTCAIATRVFLGIIVTDLLINPSTNLL